MTWDKEPSTPQQWETPFVRRFPWIPIRGNPVQTLWDSPATTTWDDQNAFDTVWDFSLLTDDDWEKVAA